MCEHCGCRGVEPIAALMDEHFSMLELAGQIRRRLDEGDRAGATLHLARLREELEPHVWVEEHGVFAAMREDGDFAEHVDELERDHLDIDGTVADLDPENPAWPERVTEVLALLEEHIAKENLGLFPAAVVSLGARGWQTVTAATAARAARMTGDLGPVESGPAALRFPPPRADPVSDEDVTPIPGGTR